MRCAVRNRQFGNLNYIHHLLEPVHIKELICIIFENKGDFCAMTKSVSAGIRVDLEGTLFSRRAENMLDGIRVLHSLRRPACNKHAIRYKERRVEAYTKCTYEIALVGSVKTLRVCLLQELRGARLRECTLYNVWKLATMVVFSRDTHEVGGKLLRIHSNTRVCKPA